MKGKLAIGFYFFLLPFSLFSQSTIKGRVVNAMTGEALSGSSVFINSTSIGTVADKAGYFELNNIPPGRYDLVISFIGYETNVFNFSSEQLPLNVKIEMKTKITELENVTVEPWVEENWAKWGTLFVESFIGKIPNARNCAIKNTKAIHFRFFTKSNRLIAYSDEPLVIENRALGYNIRYQLEEFEINFKEKTVAYAGYPFFEEIDKSRRALQRRWKEAREKAFYGSMLHFMRSLYKDSIANEGYDIRFMRRVPNYEKERVKIAYSNSMFVKDSAGVKIASRHASPDSVAYYNRIMKQKDFTEIYGPALLSTDSLIISRDGDYKLLFFPDFLFVTYKKAFEDKEYILSIQENRGPAFQQSLIWLVSGTPVSIGINGTYYPPQEVFSASYWGWSEKMANLLPSDYQPGD